MTLLVAVAVARRDDGLVLVGQRSAARARHVPGWVFPGGKAAGDEMRGMTHLRPEWTAVRELAEETGVTAVPLRGLGSAYHRTTHARISYQAVKPLAGIEGAHALPGSGLVSVEWVPLGRVLELMPDLHPPVRAYLESLAAPVAGTVLGAPGDRLSCGPQPA